MLGIVPAAGRGSRIQPLGFSKELLPVGSRAEGATERPCAVSEYLLERMIGGGADKICFVIGPGKSDIMEYYGGTYGRASIAYVVQPTPAGLCDAIFCAAFLAGDDEPVLVGLPDTVWFPADGFAALPDDGLSFLLFPVDQPQLFDAVVLGEAGKVREIQVKQQHPDTQWVWGAFKMPGRLLRELFAFWRAREGRDEYIGTLINAYLAAGGTALGVSAGRAYVDVGTYEGYRAAIGMLGAPSAQDGRRAGGHAPTLQPPEGATGLPPMAPAKD